MPQEILSISDYYSKIGHTHINKDAIIIKTTSTNIFYFSYNESSPFESSEDIVIDWGDGTVDTISEFNNVTSSHNYSTTKVYIIKVYNATKIKAQAFLNNSKINEIIIPNSITEIEQSAFYGSSLKKIFLPYSISTLPYASLNCYCDTPIFIPDSITTINYDVTNSSNSWIFPHKQIPTFTSNYDNSNFYAQNIYVRDSLKTSYENSNLFNATIIGIPDYIFDLFEYIKVSQQNQLFN